MEPEQVIEVSRQVADVIAAPGWRVLTDLLRDKYISAWRNSKTIDEMGREKAYFGLRAVDDIVFIANNVLQAGLEEQKRQDKRVRDEEKTNRGGKVT